jgi:glycosyltransferase involved in cell wall biosynthesis
VKIAVVGPAYPFRGGIAHYTMLLASHLSAQHEARLYSFERQYPAILFPGRSQIDPSAPVIEIETRRWLTPWWPFSWRRVSADWSTWQPERVIIQWWVPFMAPMTAWLLAQARRLGRHSTLICHNVLPHEEKAIDAALIRLALSRADQLIVHGQPDRERALKVLPLAQVRVAALPSYAGLRAGNWTYDRARTELKLTRPTLLFFGFVRPYKGLLDLLDALPAVLVEIDVDLLVVGEIWGEAAPYHERVKELELTERVQFIDRYVSNEEAALFFTAADLAVLPYRDATGSAVLQLAFGLGVPVVATRTGGMGEAVEDGVTGFLVEPGDVAGLSRAIVRYFHEEREATFRRNIALQADKFSWDRLMNVVLGSDMGVTGR